MTNLTIAIDEDLLQRARIRALEQGTSVNAFLRGQLEILAGGRSEQIAAVRALLARSGRVSVGSGPAGRVWTRDQLHER